MNNTSDYAIALKEDNNWSMHKLHFHEPFEIIMNLSNAGSIFLDDAVYPLEPDTVMILRPNMLHRTSCREEDQLFRRYVLKLDPSLIRKLSTTRTDFFSLLFESTAPIKLSPESAAALTDLFDRLSRLDSADFGSDIRESILLNEILLLVCDHLRQNKSAPVTISPDTAKVAPIMDYIRSIYKEPFTLDELAGHFAMSKHYLCHMFKNSTNFSVMEYTIQLRIVEAQKLLRSGLNVQDTSDRSGFQSYAYFIRTFTRYVGESPKQYAKHYRESDHVNHFNFYSGDEQPEA